MQRYTDLLIGPIEERASDGRSMTGDDWRRSLTPPAQILAFMCMVRVATLGQLARFHYLRASKAGNNGSLSFIQSTEQIESLMLTNGWLGRFKIILPSSCGGGSVAVFHLTERGRKALKKEAPVLWLFTVGRPSKRHIKYVPHNLLVTEALLRISESGCEVLEFQPESSLRRMKISERGENWRNTSGQSESLPDFSVLLRTPKNTFPRRVDCEISIQLDADQLKNKPTGVHWFVPNQGKADLIESVRGKRERVTVLGDVRSPFVDDENEAENVPQDSAKDTVPTLLDEREIHVLRLLGGVATANAIAALRRAERSGVSRSLSRLVRQEHLRRSEVKLQPGRDRGRPTALFVLSSVAALSLAARKKALIMSLMVAEMAGKSFLLKSYEVTNGILSMIHADFEDEPPLLVVVDDETLPVESIAETILSCQRADTQLMVAAADRVRIKRLGILFPNLDICDVSR